MTTQQELHRIRARFPKSVRNHYRHAAASSVPLWAIVLGISLFAGCTSLAISLLIAAIL